jgi:DNA-binding cell septation regulator SpoVG
MPQVRLKNGKYREIAFAINTTTRKMIEKAVISEYQKGAGTEAT